MKKLNRHNNIKIDTIHMILRIKSFFRSLLPALCCSITSNYLKNNGLVIKILQHFFCIAHKAVNSYVKETFSLNRKVVYERNKRLMLTVLLYKKVKLGPRSNLIKSQNSEVILCVA